MLSVPEAILTGFSVAAQPMNLVFCFVGVLTGTLVGVLPGIGPSAAIALLLPITFHAPPASVVIMLAGIYYGAMYGGSTTSILVNVPGEAASVVTCLDGYQMARQGRAGPALGMSACGSFIGGTFSVVMLGFLALPLATLALAFGPPEYFSIMTLGLILVIFIGSGPILKSIVAASFGLFLGTIGIDAISGYQRFTFNTFELMDGVGIIPVIIGVFGIAEVLSNVERMAERTILTFQTRIRGLLPTSQDWKDSKWPIARGSVVGFFLGILPGAGPILASFLSYGLEKNLSKYPEKFGTGVIEGVAGPETANNAATGGAFVPLLTLGIPVNAVMALFLGALILHGIQPGPQLVSSHPDIFWGIIASMYIGNVILLILNLPMIGVWVKILKVPYAILFPLILVFCLIGTYTINNSLIELGLAIAFGLLGYLMKKFDYDPTPLVLSLVLSPMIENNLRQSLLMSDGDVSVFFTRPISLAIFLVATAVILVAARKRRVLVEYIGKAQ